MGQYYRGVILGKTTHKAKKIIVKQAFCCYAHENGAKLMEHSYVGNWYVKEYERALANEFYGYPFVWCGDYADEKYGSQPYVDAVEFIDKKTQRAIKNAGYKYDGSRWGNECTAYDRKGNVIDCKSEKEFSDKTPYEELKDVTYDVIINFTKKEFVRIPHKTRKEIKDKTLVVHPLPLLCADGNARGGGDYWDNNADFDKVGIWAYDRIGIGFEDEIPTGFTELIVHFEEKW